MKPLLKHVDEVVKTDLGLIAQHSTAQIHHTTFYLLPTVEKLSYVMGKQCVSKILDPLFIKGLTRMKFVLSPIQFTVLCVFQLHNLHLCSD